MMGVFSTKQVAKLLGVKINCLTRAVWEERVEPPRKLGNAYIWEKNDIEKASWVLRHRSADDIFQKIAV